MNKKIKYIIVGAGGLGREISSYLKSDKNEPYAFLDDNPQALDGLNYNTPILSLKNYTPEEDHRLLLAIGTSIKKIHLSRINTKKCSVFNLYPLYCIYR